MKYFRLTVILLLLFSGIGAAEEPSAIPPLFPVTNPETEYPDARNMFLDTMDLILAHYYSSEITQEALYRAALDGMLRHISPPETPDLARIWSPENYERIRQSLEGVQVSIGIKSDFDAGDGSLTVKEILPDSPADGVLIPYDRILRINDQVLKGKSLQTVNDILIGPEGEDIRLTVCRDISVFDATLTRSRFETHPVEASKLTEKAGVLTIRKFSSGVFQQVRDALTEFKKSGIDRLIIDLRNCPGGVFEESLKIAELFILEKGVMLRLLQRETRLQNYVSTNKSPFDFSMAVLVNGKTASAAEILTTALQDNGKAVVIGEKTFGKGVLEKTFTMERNNYRIKFITGAMYSPKGKSWQGKGIIPDYLADQNESVVNTLLKQDPRRRLNQDIALNMALKLLNRCEND